MCSTQETNASMAIHRRDMGHSDRQADLKTALARFESRMAAGAFSPYANRIEDPRKRWCTFLELIKRRGQRYAMCSLENFDICGRDSKRKTSVRDELRSFTTNMPERIASGSGLVLLGPPGTGKDHLLMACLREAILTHGFTVRWHDGLELFQQVKAAIARDGTGDFFKQLYTPQILALSDPVPPRDELTAYELSVLRNVIEKRYSSGLSTWITTNVQNYDEARKLFTSAVLDRLLHGTLELFCGWESYRTRMEAKPCATETN
ncbi:MAG: ATP-binding protein [Pirellulales bacterium]|nr:ATP-binding protein [Pirellulales bacterium]